MPGFTAYNDEELAALAYLPPRAQVLYLTYLKRHMDRESGIVGIRRRISRQGMREILEVHRDRGSTLASESPSDDAIKATLKQLAGRGLIRRVHGYERVPVYRLPLANPEALPAFPSPSHDSDQMRNTRGTPEEHPRNTRGTPEEHQTRNTPEKADSGAGSEQVNTRATHACGGAMSAPPPESTIHGYSVAAAVPNSARAREALSQVLLELFPDQKKQIGNTQAVQLMLDAWVDAGVCAHHVRKAHREMSKRQGLDSFGPAYLRGLVLEFAAVDGLQVRRDRNAQREERSDKAMCQSVEQWAKERGLDWDPLGGEPYSTWLERMRIKKLKEERGAADG